MAVDFVAYGITAGPDRSMWFTEQNSSGDSRIGRLSGVIITEFSFNTPHSRPRGISGGPDGKLWFTELSNWIGRIEPGRGSAVLTLASGFSPKNHLGNQGRKVQWTFYGPNAATVTDASGMGLFDSGLKQLVSYYSFRFIAAGTYQYRNQMAPVQKGRVTIPIEVTPSIRPPSAVFRVAWASEPPPLYFAFDVQILIPGAPDFVDWRTGVVTTEADFTPYVGPGTYVFRARMRNMLKGAASGYSPEESIMVTP